MQYLKPYIIHEDDRDTQIQDEIETASILLIAMSRQGYEHPDAIVKVNYPFMIFESEEDTKIFDLLGQSKTEKKWLLPKDISEILNALEAIENGDDIPSLLKKGNELLDKEPEYSSTWIEGMLEQEDVKTYLLDNIKVDDSKEGVKLDLFQPILTKKKFSSLRKKVNSANKEIKDYILSAEQALERIENLNDVIKKDQEKKLSIFKKESETRLNKSEIEKEKAIKKIEKSLKKETKSINVEFKELLLQKTNEMDEIKAEITTLENKLENGTEGISKRDLSDLKKELHRYNREIESLGDEHRRKLSNTENDAESEKHQWEERVLNKRNEEKRLLGKLLETHASTLSGCDDLKYKINEVRATLLKNTDSLSKILDIKYGKGKNLYIPFYLFRYGADAYWFYPPIKISEEKSMRKMIKLFISSNLGNKIGQFISPQTDVIDGHLEMVVESIKEETELSDQFSKEAPIINLLESRETLDKMIVGLYQIMEWAWISEKDYIEVQRFLVKKLDILNGGKIFPIQEHGIDELLETPEVMEIPTSE